MKSILMLVLLMALSAMGTVTSDVVTCRIQVNSGTRSTILSLPFTELGGSESVTDLDRVVLTDNLENGTLLFAAVNGATHAWRLVNGGWQKMAVVDGFEHTADTAGVNSFQRGAAFWVERAGDSAALAKPFYIYGKVGEELPGNQVIAGAVTSNGKLVSAHTRIGNPNPEDCNINDLVWSGCGKDDRIVLSDSSSEFGFIEYAYNPGTGKWGLKEPYKSGKVLRYNWNYDVVLLAGQGFWYIRNTTGSASVRFKK